MPQAPENTQEPVERIEVTPEMTEAARPILSEFDPESTDRDSFLKRVYLAMSSGQVPKGEIQLSHIHKQR